MSLWEWALGVYERPGVPETCLKLQDEFGQNTSFLLWAFWARASQPGLVARAAAAARDWDRLALTPLRAVRRALKPACPPVADAAREGLREEVKAAELHAERVLVETLERMSGGRRCAHEGGEASGLAALTAASQAWGAPAPQAALAVLAAALE
jgi:uncharacterized protein (TIGR02444 family)